MSHGIGRDSTFFLFFPSPSPHLSSQDVDDISEVDFHPKRHRTLWSVASIEF